MPTYHGKTGCKLHTTAVAFSQPSRAGFPLGQLEQGNKPPLPSWSTGSLQALPGPVRQEGSFHQRADGSEAAPAGKPEQWETRVNLTSPGRFGDEMEEELRWLSATALHAVGMEKLR